MSRMKKILCGLIAAVQAVSMITFSASAKDTVVSIDTIAVGDDHSLVIKSDMSLWAAGNNNHGQLGVGTSVDQSDGIKVMDSVAMVEACGETSFAIDASGTLYGWGDNSSGQIAPLQLANYIYTPTRIMDNVVMVSVSETHTIAVASDGTAYGWGSNSYGELGTAANKNTNTARKLMENVVDAAAGNGFSVIVTADGKAYVSGDNTNGQLGLGNYRSYEFFTVCPVSGIKAVDAGSSHTLVLSDDGKVYGAGLNDNNQVSNATKSRINSFTDLGLSNIDAIFAQEKSSAAINDNGVMYAWGDNACGQLQNSSTVDILTPVKVSDNVVSAAIGAYHSIVLKTDGSISAAGEGMNGELFNFSESKVLDPERILEEVTVYSAGSDHAAAISENVLYTWGNNDCGQLGTGDHVSRAKPTKVELPSDPINVWCGDKCTFVQTEDKRVFVFGDNSSGMLGMKTKTTSQCEPISNVDLSGVDDLQIACGKGFCIALIDNTVYGWGTNGSGKLCSLPKNTISPENLSYDLDNIVAIAAGDNHCLALDAGGFLWGWGSNSSKQLSDIVEEHYTEVPVVIEVKENRTEAASIQYIDAAGNHSMVIDNENRVWAWGANANGQLGMEESRVNVTSFVGFTAVGISAGRYACAIVNKNEKLMICGSNKSGALGDGTETDRNTFDKFTSNVAVFADLGDNFGGYLRADAVLFCWGDNTVGQVGNGEGGISVEPKVVLTGALCSDLEMADGVSLNKTELVLKPNGTAVLTATVEPADADIKTIRWTSSDTSVATVTAGGVVKGISVGEAVITATAANGVKAECKVTVAIPVSSFSVSPSKSKTLKIGQSFTFTTKVYPTKAVDKTLLFESSDPDVAKVSESGKVTAVGAGAATITITAKSDPEKTKSVIIYVRPAKTSFTSRKATEDGVLLKWEETEGADGYTVYRRTSADGKSTQVADISADESLVYLDAKAKSGNTYYYFIRAYIEENGKKIYSTSYALYKIKAK